MCHLPVIQGRLAYIIGGIVAGALSGIRIIEFTSIGPGPFCGMMLADHGADVIAIDRSGNRDLLGGAHARSRRSIALDLKTPEGIKIACDLCRDADGLIEGFRPGVMERLGLGPDVLLAANDRLVYGRMTGWGQYGPLAPTAGHDINYIAIAGALHGIGRPGEKPVPPANYLADFGGGGMLLAFGMLAALLAVKNGAKGQVVDAAMTDGTALLLGLTWKFMATGEWQDQAGVNLLDGGAHFYDSYATADGKYIAIGSIEPQFYARLMNALDLAGDEAFSAQMDSARWPVLKQRLTEIFLTRTRDEWTALLEPLDLCYAPILSLQEAAQHPHNVARGVYAQVDGELQPMPAPRLSGTPAPKPLGASSVATDVVDILGPLGYDAATIAVLREAGVVG